MRRIFIVLVLIGLSPLAQGVPIADQGRIFGTGGTLQLETDFWSQSITTGVEGQLTGIQIQFHVGIPSSAPELTLEVFNGGNAPVGIPLFTEALLLSNADLDALNVFTWDLGSAGLLFGVGDIFTFAFQAADSGLEIAGNDPPGYDGGELFKNGAAFTGLSDIAFITFVEPMSIPEPGTLALLVLGLAGIGLTRRRRKF